MFKYNKCKNIYKIPGFRAHFYSRTRARQGFFEEFCLQKF